MAPFRAGLIAYFVAVIWPSASHAVGYTLEQQSASNAGYTVSGSAAAEDASGMFWNPAALSFTRGRQAVLGVNAIYGDAKFTDARRTLATVRWRVLRYIGALDGPAGSRFSPPERL
jgi:long-subunit fatty acid transport protein